MAKPDRFVPIAENPDLMTTEQLARYIGIHPASAPRWAREGFGPRRFRIGKRAYYLKSEVDAWIQSQAEEQGRGADPSAA